MITARPFSIGQQFHWIDSEHSPYLELIALATPTGWLVEWWRTTYTDHADDHTAKKLISSHMIPDKDHTLNPRCFWNNVLHGDPVVNSLPTVHQEHADRLWEQDRENYAPEEIPGADTGRRGHTPHKLTGDAFEILCNVWDALNQTSWVGFSMSAPPTVEDPEIVVKWKPHDELEPALYRGAKNLSRIGRNYRLTIR